MLNCNGGASNTGMELHILEDKLRLASIPKAAIPVFTHALIKIAFLPDSRPSFFSFTETNQEYTLIVSDDLFQELPRSESMSLADTPWRALTVSAGVLGDNTLTGVSKIVKSVICPLADNNVSIICMSTYQSDFILVKEPDLAKAISCLSPFFKIYFEDGDHSLVPVAYGGQCEDGVSSVGFTLSGEDQKIRPIIHPFHSPLNRFYVTSLNANMLPSLVPILMDLMFYSNSRSPPRGYQAFFHFSIVERDISLVLDSNALERFPCGSLYTSTADECWRMICIGDTPLGFEVCGVVSQVAEPLVEAKIPTYYISSYGLGHTMVPEGDIDGALDILNERRVPPTSDIPNASS